MGRVYERIGILDHGGYGNLGNAAIHEALIANIRRRLPKAVFFGFSDAPHDTSERYNIVSHPVNWSYPGRFDSDRGAGHGMNLRLRLKSFVKGHSVFYAVAKPISDFLSELALLARSYRAVRSLDLLIILGSGQLQDYWYGPWVHPYNIFKFCGLARLSNTSLFILNAGVGPLNHPLSRFFARWSVRLAHYTSFRDPESQALLSTLGVKTKTRVYPDTAYSLDLTPYLPDEPPSLSKPIVGLNPMGFCDPRVWPKRDSAAYNRYLDRLASFSLWLLAQGYDLEVFTTEVSVDGYAIEDLKSRLTGHLPPDTIATVFPKPALTLNEILLQMSRFNFVITPKLHGVIFSHLLAKPVIALSYHSKIDTLMHAVGQSHYCLDIERFDATSLISAFNALVSNAGDISTRFRETTATYGAALQPEFDNLFMARA